MINAMGKNEIRKVNGSEGGEVHFAVLNRVAE